MTFYLFSPFSILLSFYSDYGHSFYSNTALGEVYSIQHYVIKFVSAWRLVVGTPVSSSNKSDRHDITEILLKVTLNTIMLDLIVNRNTHFVL